MGNSTSTPKVSAQDKAILDLKLQRDKLHQYQRRLAPLVSQYHTIALHHLAQKDKPRALLALRRKKYHEALLAKTDSQLAQLELLTSDVEFALVQKDVLFGLQRGTEVLKEIRKEMGGLEGVEKMMGESAEEKAFQAEVEEMLAGRMTAEEEDEVEDELKELEMKEAAQRTDEALQHETLPKVPIRDPVSENGVLEVQKTVPRSTRGRTRQGAEDRELVPA